MDKIMDKEYTTKSRRTMNKSPYGNIRDIKVFKDSGTTQGNNSTKEMLDFSMVNDYKFI